MIICPSHIHMAFALGTLMHPGLYWALFMHNLVYSSKQLWEVGITSILYCLDKDTEAQGHDTLCPRTRTPLVNGSQNSNAQSLHFSLSSPPPWCCFACLFITHPPLPVGGKCPFSINAFFPWLLKVWKSAKILPSLQSFNGKWSISFAPSSAAPSSWSFTQK